ncbi:MAG: hypothetical protein HRT47_10240 [Candidatus Caenarcaniphilales bacterium]|nr:hypothetical protein [Candidatus Caenarcaniphilales bacterium]
MFEDDVNDTESSAFDESKARIWPPEEEFHKTEEELKAEEEERLTQEQAEIREQVLNELQEQSSNMFDSVSDFLSDIDANGRFDSENTETEEEPPAGLFVDDDSEEEVPSLFDDTPEEEPQSEPAFSEEVVDDDLSAQFDRVSAAFNEVDSEEKTDEIDYSEEEADNNSDEAYYGVEESESETETGSINNEPASASDLHTLFGYNSEEDSAEEAFDSASIFDEDFQDSEASSADSNLFIDEEGVKENDSVRVNNSARAFSYLETDSLSSAKSENESNSSLIVLLIVVLFVGGYWFYQNYSNRYSSLSSSRKSRRGRPKKNTGIEQIQEKQPIWAAVEVEKADKELESTYIKSSLENAGRENPFLLPKSAIKAIANNRYSRGGGKRGSRKGDRIKKKAYRATMVGILESEGDTIALVNLKEASFDVLESVSRSKVLKAAVKAMQKAKDNTIEVAIGDFIGNWEIVDIIGSDYDSASDPMIKLKRAGHMKILYLGKPEELGIFNAMNEFDDLSDFENDLEF